MVTAVTVTICSNRKLKNMENLKEQTILELTRDMRTVELLELIAYNWNVAVSRMEQINKERAEGLYDDDGVEAMGVFNRMERVGN